MTSRDVGSIIYWRRARGRGGRARAYLDLRGLGGKREPLIPRGQKRATTDPVIALKLAGDRLKAFDQDRRACVLEGMRDRARLASFARDHLVAKKRAGRVTDQWLAVSESYLRRAVEYFGADRQLDTISVANVREFAEALRSRGTRRRRGTLAEGTVRHHLNTLSNLFRRAASEGLVPPGHNPVASLLEKPIAQRREAHWLEIHEAALLLEAARIRERERRDELPYAHALLGTFLLTGGRQAEVLGLEVDDVSFDRRTVTFRPNAWRRLKTETSARVLPLWPQLEELLRPHVFGDHAPPGRLLFPSSRTGDEEPVREIRRLLDRVAMRAGSHAGEIRTKAFRHTYCAARLQTIDGGAPVSPYTVARELGHGGLALVHRVYGHLGQVRHRAEVVEFRIEQHRERLEERLRGLEKWWRSDATDGPG